MSVKAFFLRSLEHGLIQDSVDQLCRGTRESLFENVKSILELPSIIYVISSS